MREPHLRRILTKNFQHKSVSLPHLSVTHDRNLETSKTSSLLQNLFKPQCFNSIQQFQANPKLSKRSTSHTRQAITNNVVIALIIAIMITRSPSIDQLSLPDVELENPVHELREKNLKYWTTKCEYHSVVVSTVIVYCFKNKFPLHDVVSADLMLNCTLRICLSVVLFYVKSVRGKKTAKKKRKASYESVFGSSYGEYTANIVHLRDVFSQRLFAATQMISFRVITDPSSLSIVFFFFRKRHESFQRSRICSFQTTYTSLVNSNEA